MRRQQYASFILLLALGLAGVGCATQPVTYNINPARFLHDSAFPGSTGYIVESREKVFQPDEQIQNFLDKRAGHLHRSYDNSMFIAGEIMQSVKDFTYNSRANTTASQTYHNKMANCLSMTIMAYTMAHYLGFDTEFQLIHIPEYWEWRDRNSLVARHISLILKPPRKNGTISLGHPIEIDFFAPGSSSRYGSQVVTGSTVLAMFYNNKGAEALLTGNRGVAYAYLRAALLKDPSLGMTLNNLALLYIMEGKPYWAEQNYRESLARNPDDTVSAEGLATVLRMSGQNQEADELLREVQRKRENNPYYQYVHGEEAFADGNWQQAIIAFKKAIEIRPDLDQPYFGLAKVYFQLDDIDRAKSYLQQAERHADREEAKKRYQSKLALLSSF